MTETVNARDVGVSRLFRGLIDVENECVVMKLFSYTCISITTLFTGFIFLEMFSEWYYHLNGHGW